MNTEISWLPHFPSIKDCLCVIKFILRCLYIEDANRFMFSTEINKLNETRSGHCKTQNHGDLVNSWIRQGVCMWLWAKLCQSAYIYCIHVACSGCNWIYINICVLLIHFTIYVVYTCIQILCLSMCDVKLFLTFASLGLVVLWQLCYLFCSNIVINTVTVTAGTFEP
jgi:hypothetical protein